MADPSLPRVRGGSGPEAARFLIVGECYGEHEERALEPFVGTSGQELNRILHEAGIMRSECYVTNVVNARPRDNDISEWVAEKKKDITSNHAFIKGKWVRQIVQAGLASLAREIALIQPRVIIALGGFALWALTDLDGIKRWRGSLLTLAGGETRVVPTWHPAMILRAWDLRVDMVQDLRRAAGELEGYTPTPPWRFRVRPSFTEVQETLAYLGRLVEDAPLWLDFDIETKAGHITCVGVSWTALDAIIIPLMSTTSFSGYWSLDEETAIVYGLYELLTHPNARVRWQNGLYDAQYTYRHWCFIPRGAQDTMISQHTLWAGRPKALDYQASIYCEHYVNWKPDKVAWKEGG